MTGILGGDDVQGVSRRGHQAHLRRSSIRSAFVSNDDAQRAAGPRRARMSVACLRLGSSPPTSLRLPRPAAIRGSGRTRPESLSPAWSYSASGYCSRRSPGAVAARSDDPHERGDHAFQRPRSVGHRRLVCADGAHAQLRGSCSPAPSCSPASPAASAAARLRDRDRACPGVGVFLFFVKFFNVGLPAGWSTPYWAALESDTAKKSNTTEPE